MDLSGISTRRSKLAIGKCVSPSSISIIADLLQGVLCPDILPCWPKHHLVPGPTKGSEASGPQDLEVRYHICYEHSNDEIFDGR
jgi:hypothetical protein